MMIGFACDETESLMPMPLWLADGLTRRLAQVRRAGSLPWLRPDGKAQVTVEYAEGRPHRVATVVVSTQHTADASHEQIERGILEHVIAPTIPGELLDDATQYYINPAGNFIVGGPAADAGLTGRKIIVDTYGGIARHGGGAFSGKDPSKVDRSAAYAARWVAKNIVAAELAERAEVQVSYAIGRPEPTSLTLLTFGTARIPERALGEVVREHFDLRPLAVIDRPGIYCGRSMNRRRRTGISAGRTWCCRGSRRMRRRRCGSGRGCRDRAVVGRVRSVRQACVRQAC